MQGDGCLQRRESLLNSDIVRKEWYLLVTEPCSLFDILLPWKSECMLSVGCNVQQSQSSTSSISGRQQGAPRYLRSNVRT